MITKKIKVRKSSFVKGMARVLDLGSTLNIYVYSNEPEGIDCNALRSDWEMVGEDIKLAINNYKRDIHGKTERIFNH